MRAAESVPRAKEQPSGLVILGHPVAHSLSPVFQTAALRVSGLTQVYERWDTRPEDLDATLDRARALRLGGNVTIPLKGAMAERAGWLSPAAVRAGAVNTFWFEDDILFGHNTDVAGAEATLAALVPTGPLGRVVVLGAGGAAAAVLVALGSREGSDIVMVARSRERGEALLRRTAIAGRVYSPNTPDAAEILRHADLVINTTPVGMQNDDHPVSIDMLSPAAAVFDLVYKPHGTAWVRDARRRGLRAEDGLRMLVEQGAAAFQCWFGREAPRHVMWEALGRSAPAPDAPRG